MGKAHPPIDLVKSIVMAGVAMFGFGLSRLNVLRPTALTVRSGTDATLSRWRTRVQIPLGARWGMPNWGGLEGPFRHRRRLDGRWPPRVVVESSAAVNRVDRVRDLPLHHLPKLLCWLEATCPSNRVRRGFDSRLRYKWEVHFPSSRSVRGSTPNRWSPGLRLASLE